MAAAAFTSEPVPTDQLLTRHLEPSSVASEHGSIPLSCCRICLALGPFMEASVIPAIIVGTAPRCVAVEPLEWMAVAPHAAGRIPSLSDGSCRRRRAAEATDE